mmetsp:Transcript_20709/g.61832  ORF Transcript_20709/g.61832 Transcript_20709/m.61832 type:complete len:201 (+) Transcript_20709:639-1241(+)
MSRRRRSLLPLCHRCQCRTSSSTSSTSSTRTTRRRRCHRSRCGHRCLTAFCGFSRRQCRCSSRRSVPRPAPTPRCEACSAATPVAKSGRAATQALLRRSLCRRRRWAAQPPRRGCWHACGRACTWTPRRRRCGAARATPQTATSCRRCRITASAAPQHRLEARPPPPISLPSTHTTSAPGAASAATTSFPASRRWCSSRR